ncbi:MAG: hypothetical protein JWO19_4785 [Bryobacterales bacterium]|nr:hypothetical protein [Bryobacterales bacterium]
MKAVAIATIPLFAGFLFAQNQSRTETRTTTTKTTWNGTLVDAACQSTHTERRETTSNRGVTRSETTHTESVDCPVTTSTSLFGLLTADGRFIRFDDPSNSRVVEIVRSNQAMNRYLADRAPIRVNVIGTANGDVAVVESLNPEGQVVTSVDADRVDSRLQPQTVFDVRYHDDRGKLVITDSGVRFEDISNAKHSRTWNYAQIKELKRNGGNEVKIEPYSGDSYELQAEGPFMSDAVYNTIADRIVAARGR